MFRSLLPAAALLGLLGIAPAHATVVHGTMFDFLAEANKMEAGYRSYTLTRDGLTVTARGYSGPNEVFAYLDRGDAGMGVCKVLDARAQCSPGSDDNVTHGERLNLTFDRAVTMTSTFLRAEGHVPRFEHGDRIDFAVDGVRYDDVPMARDGRFFLSVTGTSFDYSYDNEQFYVAAVTAYAAPKPAPVPEPASALLLGLGVMGLVLARRCRA